MKVGKDFFDQDKAFLAIEKDLALIIQKIMGNQNLLKMLYYTQPDCLKAKDLTMKEISSMINKEIRIVPKLNIEQECPNYVIITMDNFTPNKTNPEFMDCTISFDILCHPDHWNMGNFKLRPFKIASEISSMIKNKKLSGIGVLQFMNMTHLIMNDEMCGLTMTYKAIHGVEDEIDPLS